jgi:hypothetical protein
MIEFCVSYVFGMPGKYAEAEEEAIFTCSVNVFQGYRETVILQFLGDHLK